MFAGARVSRNEPVTRVYDSLVAERSSLGRTVAAMRTALIDRPTRRFDAMPNIGPHPKTGSIIEAVHRDRRRVIVEWDNGLMLETTLRFNGTWHLYRSGERWRLPMFDARVVIEVDGWVAVCFRGVEVETYRSPDRLRHPRFGGVGPDLRSQKFDVESCVRRIIDYDDADGYVVDLLGDPRVFAGVGNVDRSEVLWTIGLHPLARIGDLSYEDCYVLVETTRYLVNATNDRRVVYARNGQLCGRCHGTIQSRMHGEDRRRIFWCPDCQRTVDIALDRSSVPQEVRGHPAEVMYLEEARAARERLRIFDDTDLGQRQSS